jgi:hypothetical protein
MKFDMRTAIGVTILALVVSGSAIAQTADVLGITPVSTAGIYAIKAIALGGIAWGFLRMMGGRHTVEGLVEMGVGGLGIAKSQAIATFFGM